MEFHKHNLKSCRQYLMDKIGYVYISVERKYCSDYIREFDINQFRDRQGLRTCLKKSEIGDIQSIKIHLCDGEYMLKNGFLTDGQDTFYKRDNLEAVTQYVDYMRYYDGLYIKYYKNDNLVSTNFFELYHSDVCIYGVKDYDAIAIEILETENIEPSVEGVDEVDTYVRRRFM